METITLRTPRRTELIDITDRVQDYLQHMKAQDGLCVVYVPHTTAGITINEHADPDVAHDILVTLNKLVPFDDPEYRHEEGNSAAHVKASLLGSSVQVLVKGGQLVLGTWQGIFFGEFDGPRQRQVQVSFVPLR